MQVRPARPGDAAAIADVHVRTWQAAYEHVFGAERLATIDRDERRRLWERGLAEGWGDVWVAEDDAGSIVGFVSVGDARDADEEGELFAIYVVPEAWGGGAGSQLMEAGCGRLRERYATAILWVLDDNPRARRFYEREGWTADGAVKDDAFLGQTVREVRYRIRFP